MEKDGSVWEIGERAVRLWRCVQRREGCENKIGLMVKMGERREWREERGVRRTLDWWPRWVRGVHEEKTRMWKEDWPGGPNEREGCVKKTDLMAQMREGCVNRRKGCDKKTGLIAQMEERCTKRKKWCEKKIDMMAQIGKRCVKTKEKGMNTKLT